MWATKDNLFSLHPLLRENEESFAPLFVLLLMRATFHLFSRVVEKGAVDFINAENRSFAVKGPAFLVDLEA